MKNRIVMLVLAAALIVSLVFVGCAKPTPAPGPTPTPTPEEKVFEWTFQQGAGRTGTKRWDTLVEFTEKVKRASDGRFIINPVLGGAVCPSTKELEAVHNGVLEIGSGSAAWCLDLVPTGSIFAAPVGGMDAAGMRVWYEYGGGKALWDKATERFNVVCLPENPIQNFTPEIWCFSTFPIKSMADLQGKKMRAMGDAGAMLNRLGLSVVFLPPGEIYESLQRGVLDMAESTGPNSIVESAYYEIAQYYYFSSSRASTDCGFAWVNKDAWEDLPPDLQEILTSELRWVGWESLDTMIYDDKMALDTLREYGCIMEPLPADINVALLAEAEKYYAEMAAKDAFFAEVLQSQTDFRKLYDELSILNTPLME